MKEPIRGAQRSSIKINSWSELLPLKFLFDKSAMQYISKTNGIKATPKISINSKLPILINAVHI